jgi:hypothetical protein
MFTRGLSWITRGPTMGRLRMVALALMFGATFSAPVPSTALLMDEICNDYPGSQFETACGSVDLSACGTMKLCAEVGGACVSWIGDAACNFSMGVCCDDD